MARWKPIGSQGANIDALFPLRADTVRVLLVADGPIPHRFMNFRGNEVVSYLTQRGQELWVVCPRSIERLAQSDAGLQNVRFTYLSFYKPVLSPVDVFQRLGLLISMVFQIRKLIRNYDFDVIRAISFLPALASIISRGRKTVPLVTNLSDFYSDLYQQFGLPLPSLSCWLIRLMERLVASKSDTLIVDSPRQREKFVLLGSNPETTVVIPHAIPSEGGDAGDLSPNLFDPSCAFPRVQDPEVIFYIGDISELDGLDVMIRSLPYILSVNDRARLLIVGSGTTAYTNSLMRLVSDQGLKDFTCFVKAIPHSQIRQVISKCSICVAPFRITETSSSAVPNKILEYLGTDVPIVCSDSPAIRCMIGDILHYVDSADPVRLAETIAMVLKEKQSNSEKLRRALLRETLSWQRVMEAEEEIIKRTKRAEKSPPLRALDFIPSEILREAEKLDYHWPGE